MKPLSAALRLAGSPISISRGGGLLKKTPGLADRAGWRFLLTRTKDQSAPTKTLSEIIGQFREWGFPEFWSGGRCHLPPITKLPTKQSELPARHMIDSYQDAVVPLASNEKLRERYLTFFNTVRFGRLLEDLDMLAGLISYHHNMDPTKGPGHSSSLAIVTASVDRINMRTHSISPHKDLYLRGHVTWVGQSSMEVTMDVRQDGSNDDSLLLAKFMMVARNPLTGKKAFVNPLVATSSEEEKMMADGDVSNLNRSRRAHQSLLKTPPSEYERLIVHELFLQTLDERAATFKHPIKPDGSVWMGDTLLKNVIICFPEKRNIHNKIFGGYLMRKAFEIGWATCSVYSKLQPVVLAVDDIVFSKPVSIGSLLYLSGQVVYTKGPHVQVRVHAEVVNPQTGVHQTTNIFHFTFNIGQSSHAVIPQTYAARSLAQVIPKTYAEFMMYLEGKRHHEVTMASS